MLFAKPGQAPVLDIRPRHYLRQALLITLLNPKAIVFYMAFFPLFIDPARNPGLTTYGIMALSIAVLTFLVRPHRGAAHPPPCRAATKQPPHRLAGA